MIPRPIRFAKFNSAGNDFVCIDNTSGFLDELAGTEPFAAFVRAICRRGLAVGADGVILACQIGSGDGVDVVARFLEPDGSEARLCGNGTACFTYWVISSGLLKGPEVKILTAAGTAQGKMADEDPQRIRVCVPDPSDLQMDIAIRTNSQEWLLDYVNTGVPHAIAYVNNLDELDVAHLGHDIRWHPQFAPRGVNANFVQTLDVGRIAVRTYEFGVEAETLACGTGSAAAAILTALRQQWPTEFLTGERSVEVLTRSGDTLQVWFVCKDGSNVTDVCLETRVRPVYDGTLRDEFINDVVINLVPAKSAKAAAATDCKIP
jgi:diaminopimelate epimerase